MTPAQLSRTVLHTVRRAVEADELCVTVPERVKVRTPPRPGCGDYATNVALQLARGDRGERGDGGDPLRIAEILRRRLVRTPGIARVDIAAPGFLNITLDAGSHGSLVATVLAQGAGYGHGEGLAGERVRFAAGTADGDIHTALVAQVVRGLVTACGGRTADDGPGGEVLTVRAAGVTADELLIRLGPDAARWALLRPAAQDLPDLDPGRLLSQREANPLFRVRYAHARARAVLRNAHDLGVDSKPDEADYGHPAETALLAPLGDFPRTIEAAARDRAPDRLVRHLVVTADAFFRFHDTCPPLPRGEQKPSAVHRSRTALAEAAGTVLANGLHLLGITAPEHL
ncbi:ArgS-related anticodon-binding protein NrtL [Streptomyces cucumeris]|uniref:ArgS-related anticodon-binding protein NrtL n=1 Tax=Streptomyces cucumeris TaxID=2962890 RepID=UPI0020C9366C|nr:DALR anticodon-binding domain-containing protein [Streptomyces sp. NEAU-Y11]MCP9206410.1 DALR anticodon-binding domain-containing protein [Streptomyces sp. NEAU-Y11]